ncbi:MAG TPA: histidine kinase dimerization/phospho-acceptor domain-containing protein, partial [Verrucomicrobiae bacterium]|nr:histidine kinase dimerization/phospho-acceptor domain-containing protein [Verrucomicrobiae bacterium]
MSRAVDFPTSRTVEHADDLPPGGVLVGGGEMGSLIRAFDWSATPVGPIASWPQSLRAAVNIILGSRYPMFVWWGRMMVNFYNDSYIPLLGKRHPAALGRSAFDVWADVWPICGPQAEAVLNEGKSTWNEELLLIMERNGFTEEAYFTFSYSPVLDDLGRPGGIFCAVTEDTARVLGRRRLKTLRDLGERALVESKTDAQACQAAATVLLENPYDFAFALMYLLDADGRRCRLAETVNYAPGAKASPPEISLFDEGDLWSFKDVLKTNESRLVKNLRERFGPMPAGCWTGDHAESALVLPLAKAGVQDLPAGFLVAGLSPRLEFNDDYHGFLELAAGHIATAIANARAYQAQRERAESLAELDRAKTAFFSNISHEFRTPLTLMLGPLDELLSNPDASLAAEKREQLTVMHRNSRRLLKLVNTLLEFSRIEAGRVQANFEPTELGGGHRRSLWRIPRCHRKGRST